MTHRAGRNYRRLEFLGHQFEWEDIKRDVEALQEVTVEENVKSLPSGPHALKPAAKSFK